MSDMKHAPWSTKPVPDFWEPIWACIPLGSGEPNNGPLMIRVNLPLVFTTDENDPNDPAYEVALTDLIESTLDNYSIGSVVGGAIDDDEGRASMEWAAAQLDAAAAQIRARLALDPTETKTVLADHYRAYYGKEPPGLEAFGTPL